MPSDLDKQTIDALRKSRVLPDLLKKVPVPQDAPVTATAGIPGLKMYEDPLLRNTDTTGYVHPRAAVQDDAMFVQPNLNSLSFFGEAPDPTLLKQTVAHEAEHLLAKRQLGTPANINSMFDQLSNNPKSKDLRSTFVRDASRVYPYLKEKYGVDSAYLDPEMLKFQGPLAPNLAYEQLATLAQIEATTGVDLTKDPYLRKNLFKSREVREIYNALTGLRQTRLDAKDLPPHTRIKEKDSGRMSDFMESVKSKEFSEGGFVAKPLPGGSKLI